MKVSTLTYGVVGVVVVLTALSGAVGAVDGTEYAPTSNFAADEIVDDGHGHAHLDGGAVAQQSNETQTPKNGSDGAQSTTGNSGGNKSRIVERVDDAIVVADYTYNDSANEFTVTLQHVSDDAGVTTVTLTEVVLAETDGKGSTTFGVQQVKVRPGSTVDVVIDARRWDGVAGVTITTAASIDAGNGVMLWDVQKPDYSIFTGEATWGTVRAVWLFTGTCTGLGIVGFAWHVVAQRNEDVDYVDLRGDDE